ncbi:MAG: LysM peptidoglycan-binding domain-containing protein, partial [Chloroflexi bacterium]|nr:LysM peptidoglycan-binding domain-containing protein [Chloroflexota bacterium]
YLVQAGDTLDSLSRRTNTSVYDLQQVNCLQSFTIQPGQTIYLPFNPPTSTPTGTSTPVTPSPTPSRTGTPTSTPRAPEVFRADVSIDRTTISVVGRYFRPDEEGFIVELRGTTGAIPLALGRLRSSTSFEADLPPPSNLPGGTYDLRVINPDNQFAVIRVTIPP